MLRALGKLGWRVVGQEQSFNRVSLLETTRHKHLEIYHRFLSRGEQAK
jgi:hypothetical protein